MTLVKTSLLHFLLCLHSFSLCSSVPNCGNGVVGNGVCTEPGTSCCSLWGKKYPCLALDVNLENFNLSKFSFQGYCGTGVQYCGTTSSTSSSKAPISTAASHYCGNGIVGNGVCPDPNSPCCSQWGNKKKRLYNNSLLS